MGRREQVVLDGETLEKKVFPRLAEELSATGEVYVEYDYATHFAHWLMLQQHALWQRTEQEVHITDDFKARFYLMDT